MTNRSSPGDRFLVVGFFSTIGDIECLDVVTETLDHQGFMYDVAPFHAHVHQAIPGSIELSGAEPRDYGCVVVVCGPCSSVFFDRFGLNRFLESGARFVGVNLTMVESTDRWNPFDVLIERDSDRTVRPDLTFAVTTDQVPVISTCFIEAQDEYGDRQGHADVIGTVDTFVETCDIARIRLDTRWPRAKNVSGLGSAAQIASALRRTDLLITNRLHGLVFALKTGVPVIAIDSVRGGGKLSQQAAVLAWPCCIPVEQLSSERLSEALAWCMTTDAGIAIEQSQKLGRDFDHELADAFTKAHVLPRRPRQAPLPVNPLRARIDRVKKRLRRLARR